jgi:hypothetical protein
MKWLREKGCELDWKVFELSIDYGNVKIINWLLDENCPVDMKYVTQNLMYLSPGDVWWLEILSERSIIE